MTDKVQKIKEWICKEQDGLMDEQGNFEYPEHEGAYHILCNLDAFIESLQEEPDPYIQYASREAGIKAHAEDYSFNIESELFQQLTSDQQNLWRKEIEQAVISGGYCGLNLSRDKRYDKEEPSIPEIVDEHYWEMLGEEPVSKVWHDASKEPNDMSHCLIFYGDKNDVGHYLHYEPVLYNHQEKVFVTESFPHPTGYKVEQKSIDGGCVTEVYKNKRDRISISDITSWCYLNDLHNLTQKEEPVSEDLGEYINKLSKQFPEVSFAKLSRIAVRVAKWQKEQDQSTIELAEDHAMLAGIEKMKEQMMKDAIELEVKKDAGGYPYIDCIELYDYDKDVPLAKKGDKYKVILIKEE